MTVGLTAIAMLVGCAAGPQGLSPAGSATPSPAATASPAPTSAPTATATAEATPRGADPARVVIPAIDLDEPLIPLGLDSDGAMEVPTDYDDVGWFTGGGRPGGLGPTVIAAHVDSGWGPAVFARLVDLAPGDVVEVINVHEAVSVYEVVEVADHPRGRFPTARVFGPTSTDELRLITCHGFDGSVGEYLDNRVVYAQRVDGR